MTREGGEGRIPKRRVRRARNLHEAFRVASVQKPDSMPVLKATADIEEATPAGTRILVLNNYYIVEDRELLHTEEANTPASKGERKAPANDTEDASASFFWGMFPFCLEYSLRSEKDPQIIKKIRVFFRYEPKRVRPEPDY